MCTVPILWLLPQYEEVTGVGVGISQYRPIFLAQLQYVYSTDNTTTTKAKGVVIGVLQRDKCRDSWHYDINQIYDWRWQYVYCTNITISPNNNGVVDRINSYGDNFRGFSTQNLMVRSSSYLILFILLFVCTVVCFFAGMYYNISVVCLCRREVCRGSISCRHIERQPQLTPTKQVCKNVLWARKLFVQNKASRMTIFWPKMQHAAWTCN